MTPIGSFASPFAMRAGAYSQALADHAHALVTLELAAAIWDVSF